MVTWSQAMLDASDDCDDPGLAWQSGLRTAKTVRVPCAAHHRYLTGN